MIKSNDSYGITYTEKDGLLYPGLTLPAQSDEDIGRFGRMREQYLKEHRKAFYSIFCIKFELNDHLREINQQAIEQIELISSQLAQAEGVSDQLKAREQLGRVQAVNSCRARAVEIVVRETVLA